MQLLIWFPHVVEPLASCLILERMHLFIDLCEPWFRKDRCLWLQEGEDGRREDAISSWFPQVIPGLLLLGHVSRLQLDWRTTPPDTSWAPPQLTTLSVIVWWVLVKPSVFFCAETAPNSKLTYIPQNEFRPGPLCHRGLRQISENFVHMDLSAPNPPRLPHDGEHLHRGHAALSLPGERELGGRESVLRPRYTQPEPQPVGFLLLLLRCLDTGQPDRARPMWPRMGVQQGDFPEHNSHRGIQRCGCAR